MSTRLPDSRTRVVRSVLALFPLVLTGGCSVQAQPTPEASVVAKTYAIPCDDAHRYAAKALKVRDLAIIAVERGASGGRLVGKNEKEEIEIRLSCGPAGVTVSAFGGLWMEQGIRMSFANMVEQGDRIWPPPKGPKIFLERRDGVEAKLDFPGELEPLGMTAVRVRALNGGSRAIRIEPRRIVARTDTGSGARALSEDGVKVKLAAVDPAIDAKILRSTTLEQGAEALGFIFFPAGRYASVVVKVVDVETGEADEFEIFLKP